LRTFFKERVEQKHFDRVRMSWAHGHDPSLVLFDTAGRQASVTNVEGKSPGQLRDLLVGYGFEERVRPQPNADL
jgi:hypothetical protein